MQRNRVFLLPLLLVLPLLLGPATAWAQGPPPSSFTLSWSALDPGNDWTAQIIQSVFPIAGAAPASYATGKLNASHGARLGLVLNSQPSSYIAHWPIISKYWRLCRVAAVALAASKV